MNLKYPVLILFLSLYGIVFAFIAPPKQLAVIASFSTSQNIEVLKEKLHLKFYSIESLNLDNTILVFKYYDNILIPVEAESIVKSITDVIVVQEDSKVYFRSTVPNDSLFLNQWHLPLIKATSAWDYSRGGVNRRGDTIVIAVVDDGLHINHPDFQGNIWINYADTLGNGIDDDGNGYIDDTYGWNFQSNNNDISDSAYYVAKHGSPVAGIIGAKGNNNIGVSGIMWHVKLMIVNIADTGDFPEAFQSDVIKAYSYLLHQRKLYNASNGQKGAFVVAENSSWGVDFGKAHEAPLWCSFYDSLGKYGILSVSAVANAEKNPETQGDLPTLCPSDHLIAVGGSTGGDNYGGSAYSTISVDLSAPGYNVFSTNAYSKLNIQVGNVYKSGFSGTSFSAPMVTGAIGLLHANACEKLLDSIKVNPAYGNYILRRAILEGVDVLPTLDGKNASSGRLNILGSIKVLNDFCSGELSVSDAKYDKEIQLFPNPGISTVVNVLSVNPVLSVRCFDANGRLVDTNFDSNLLDIRNLADGIYTLEIKTDFGVYFKKFVCSNQ